MKNKIIETLGIMKQIYVLDLQKQRSVIELIHKDLDILKIQTDNINAKIAGVENVMTALTDRLNEKRITLPKNTSLIYKMTLGHCSNYISGLQKPLLFGQEETEIEKLIEQERIRLKKDIDQTFSYLRDKNLV